MTSVEIVGCGSIGKAVLRASGVGVLRTPIDAEAASALSRA
jgi:predicted dinucleotide-utilizing enzyme